LEPFKDREAGALSGGMKQKLALCCALVHRPEILFLDEPTTGVDAVSRREFWELLGRLRTTGLTIVVSTPYMDEAERCDRVALVQNGHILAIDTPVAITHAFGRPLFAIRARDRYPALLALRQYPNTESVYPFGETLHYTDTRGDIAPERVQRDVVEYLTNAGVVDPHVTTTDATIEDSFIARMRQTEPTA
jgi:ABC-type multidrug transport system ATPase subunit